MLDHSENYDELLRRIEKTAAAHRLHGRMKFQGLDISVENRKGSIRRWFDPHGKETGHTKMFWNYGYIRGTEGTDGDHVDVYVGPDADAAKVYIVNQMKKPADGAEKWTEFDEQKCMLGFPSADEAKAAYLKQYDDPRFFGSMKEMDMATFTAKVLDKSNHGKKVASARLGKLIAEMNLRKLAEGEEMVTGTEVLGRTPLVSSLPAMTRFSEAVDTRDGKAQADAAMKTAGVGDRVDDAGIALLAAPYAADVAGKAMSHAGSPKVKALGAALRAGAGTESPFGHSKGRELTGLAMVAPSVSHSVEKLAPKKRAAIEKVAATLYEDFEYLPEGEKTALVEKLLGMAGKAAPRLVVGAERAAASAAKPIAAKAGEGLIGGAPSMGQRLVAGVKQKIAPVPRTFAVPSHAVAGTPAASAAIPRTSTVGSKWNPLTTKNLLMGTAATGLGLAGYAGDKGINTASAMLTHPQEAMGIPSVQGPGRAF